MKGKKLFYGMILCGIAVVAFILQGILSSVIEHLSDGSLLQFIKNRVIYFIPIFIYFGLSVFAWKISKKQNISNNESKYLIFCKIVINLTFCLLILVFCVRIFLFVFLNKMDSNFIKVINFNKILSYIPGAGFINTFGTIIYFSLTLNLLSYFSEMDIATLIVYIEDICSFTGIIFFFNGLEELLSDKDRFDKSVSVFSSFGNALKKFFTFKGYASRKEFFPLFILNAVIASVFILSNNAILISSEFSKIVYVIYLIYVLVFFIPYFSLYVRRVHDAGFSGIFAIIPLVNLYIIFLPSKKNTRFDNDGTLTVIGKIFAGITYLSLLAFLVYSFLAINFMIY